MNYATGSSNEHVPSDDEDIDIALQLAALYNSPRLPRQIPINEDHYKRGPQRLASIGDAGWRLAATHERLARQRDGLDGEYLHQWWVKDPNSTQTAAIAKDVQALATTWGKPLQRSADEPDAQPVFSPTEISFNAREDGCDDFRYPLSWGENLPAGQTPGYGRCNTDMLPYDQLVAATMLVIKYHLGDGVVTQSDGEHNSATWSAAVNLYLRTFPDRDVPNIDNWPGAQGRIKEADLLGHSDPPNAESASTPA